MINGHSVIKRFKAGYAKCVTPLDKNNYTGNKMNKMKHSVQSIVEKKGKNKNNLDDAVLKLVKYAEMNEQIHRAALQFKKNQWHDEKRYLE